MKNELIIYIRLFYEHDYIKMSQNNELRDMVIKSIKSKINLDTISAKDLEIGIFNYCIKKSVKYQIAQNWNDDRFQNIYKSKALSVLNNLDKKSYIKNTKLIERLNEGEFLPHDIPFMDNSNMYPEVWRKMLDDKFRRENLMLNTDNGGAKTDQFRCGRCKKTETTYYEQQIRSSDEPMTCFVTCLNCGNNWRC